MNRDDTLAAALLDVRKAYRLLYGFHRRVFDMARTIDGCLDGFTFNGSDSGYSFLGDKWKPQKKRICYWDALPFYSTYFLWIKCKDLANLEKKSWHVNASDRLFGIEMVVDDLADSAEECDPESFGQPESAKTTVRFFFGRALVERDHVSIKDAWDVDVEETEVVTRSDDGSFVLWREDIDMATLATKADVISSIRAFIAKAESALKSA